MAMSHPSFFVESKKPGTFGVSSTRAPPNTGIRSRSPSLAVHTSTVVPSASASRPLPGFTYSTPNVFGPAALVPAMWSASDTPTTSFVACNPPAATPTIADEDQVMTEAPPEPVLPPLSCAWDIEMPDVPPTKPLSPGRITKTEVTRLTRSQVARARNEWLMDRRGNQRDCDLLRKMRNIRGQPVIKTHDRHTPAKTGTRPAAARARKVDGPMGKPGVLQAQY